MKLRLISCFLIVSMLIIVSSGCKKEKNYGSVYFYIGAIPNIKPNAGNLPILVIINHNPMVADKITNPLPFDTPVGVPSPYTCPSPGSANFRLPPGTYSYTATGADSFSTSGVITIYANSCMGVGL